MRPQSKVVIYFLNCLEDPYRSSRQRIIFLNARVSIRISIHRAHFTEDIMKKLAVLFTVIFIVFASGCQPPDFKNIFMERFQAGRFPVSSFNGISDSYISENAPTTSYDASNYLELSASSGSKNRTLLKFDLRGYLPETITIEKASLTLFISGYYGTSTLEAYKLTLPWVESSVTWNNTGYESWTGGTWDPALIGSKQVVGLDSITIDLDTTVARSWFNDTLNDRGIILKLREEDASNSNIYFHDSEFATDYLRPLLTIYYSIGHI
jgi:hypothetical protein